MKKIFISSLAVLIFCQINAQQLNRSIRPVAGPAPEVKIKDPQTFTLPNGLKVIVVENHKLPIISYKIELNIKPETEGNKVGYRGFVGPLMLSGTKTLSKEKYNEMVDLIGADLSATSRSISGSSLIKNQEKMLQLMSDALLNPVFPDAELAKLKTQTAANLAQEKENPESMLGNVTSAVLYGKSHPYGEILTEETLENITINDCKNYYNKYFKPNVAYLAIVGDITLEKAKQLATKYFGKWAKGTVAKATYPKAKFATKTAVHYVSRDNAVQSLISVTYPVEIKPGSADVIKSSVMNELLGGSSESRLFQNLRETHAWTYGAYSQLKTGEEVGFFEASASARNTVTDSSINEILAEMNGLRNSPVSNEAVQNKIKYMIGGFAMGLENPATIAQFAINIDKYNLPKDYFKNYLKNLSKVTPADVLEMAKKYLHPDKANIIVVGVKEEAEKLKRFSADAAIKYYDNLGNPL